MIGFFNYSKPFTAEWHIVYNSMNQGWHTTNKFPSTPSLIFYVFAPVSIKEAAISGKFMEIIFWLLKGSHKNNFFYTA